MLIAVKTPVAIGGQLRGGEFAIPNAGLVQQAGRLRQGKRAARVPGAPQPVQTRAVRGGGFGRRNGEGHIGLRAVKGHPVGAFGQRQPVPFADPPGGGWERTNNFLAVIALPDDDGAGGRGCAGFVVGIHLERVAGQREDSAVVGGCGRQFEPEFHAEISGHQNGSGDQRPGIGGGADQEGIPPLHQAGGGTAKSAGQHNFSYVFRNGIGEDLADVRDVDAVAVAERLPAISPPDVQPAFPDGENGRGGFFCVALAGGIPVGVVEGAAGLIDKTVQVRVRGIRQKADHAGGGINPGAFAQFKRSRAPAHLGEPGRPTVRAVEDRIPGQEIGLRERQKGAAVAGQHRGVQGRPPENQIIQPS